MRLADPIPLRLTVEKREIYEAQAAAAEQPLSTFLRERLEREDVILDELRMLRRHVDRLADRAPGGGAGTSDQNSMSVILIELLLTVRKLGGVKSSTVQQELERQGLTIWSASK